MTQFTNRNPARRRSLPPAMPPRGTASASGVVVATTAVSVSNTTSETDLVSLQLPANAFTQDRSAIVNAAGSFTHSTSTGDVIFRFKVNTQTVLQTATITPTTSTDPRAWAIQGTLVASSSQEQQVAATIHLTPDSTETWKVGDWTAEGFGGAGYGTSTQPSTDAIDIKVTAQFSNATTGWIVTSESALLEQVR